MIIPIKQTFKQSITSLLDSNYAMSMAWRAYLIERLLDRCLFIVYSDGKVGSTTLTVSLKKNYPNQFVFHIHRLTEASIAEIENYYQQNKTKPSQIPDNVVQSKFLHQNLATLFNTHKLCFFSLVRDPIAALVSEYCENYPYAQKSLVKSEDEIATEMIQTLFDLFKSDKIQSRLNWFDWELKQALDFDIYTETFEKEKGYHIYSVKNLLILKLEMLNTQITSAMKVFLGCHEFFLEKGNQAEVSSYHHIYQKVKQAIKLPAETLDKIYTSKYVQYFYQDDEIQIFRQRWQQ